MTAIKSMIKAIVGYEQRQLIRALIHMPRNILALLENYSYDFFRFMRASSSLELAHNKTQLLAWIDADAHKLEKGLSLSAPRAGFGKGVAERLVREILTFKDKFGSHDSLETAIDVLAQYVEFNQKHEVVYEALFHDIEALHKLRSHYKSLGGCDEYTKAQWLEQSQFDLESFVKSRRSIRHFADKPVDLSLIEKAVSMAMHTPTVCNRQAVKAHAYLEPASIQKVLACQQGNSGFGNQAKAALVVTVDRESFFTAAERNQCWIDGGLFSMSLVYALHALGLGACCLNWSADKTQDLGLRKVVNFKESEAVIMMIAVGHLPDQFKVAKSSRKQLQHFLSVENLKN